ncbi:hypothetical protein [Shewanella khirikhana]|uniref:hypothetical protein n=1 Tax=Shewanella khirikhana TaxID=1965282 RepID=UPI000F7E0995|nr:hypothetical protein [Shewanella khirikhana]
MNDCGCKHFHCPSCVKQGGGFKMEYVSYKFKIDNLQHVEKAVLYFESQNKIAICSAHVFRAVCLMMHNVDVVISKEFFIGFVWKERCVAEGSIPVLMHLVRGIFYGTDYQIVTVRCCGYMLSTKSKL